MEIANTHDASAANATEEKFLVMEKANDEQQIASEEEKVKQQVEQMVGKVDELEQRINKVAQFYSSIGKKKSNNTKGNSVKDRERDKVTANLKRQEAAQREIASEKRMQELIRQFGTILRQKQ
ncbi:Transcription factor [Nymphaea thermarum]|nr:Transcription factor [Nymphaea thermarum]